MVRLKRVALGVATASLFLALSGCPSPFLAAIKQAVANAPFNAPGYTFVRQWGNPNPPFTFVDPIVKVDTAGYAYVTDGSFRISKFNGAGAWQKTFSVVSSAAGFGTSVNDMAFDAAGNMYVTLSAYVAQKYSVSGTRLFEIGTGTSGSANGQFGGAQGICVDNLGNIYVVDSSNNRIQKFDSTGAYVTQWGAIGTALGQYSYPRGIAYYNGSVYVADSSNNRIQYTDTAGVGPASWGGVTTYPAVTGSLTLLALSSPTGIAVDGSGNVFVTDSGNSRVVEFSFTGTYIASWGSVGTANGQFTGINSLSVDASGTVYVSDNGPPGASVSNQGRVQRFNSSGTFLSAWGGDSRSGDGSVSVPGGVVYDSAGNSYVADDGNSRIEKFDPNGNFLLKWGSAGAGQGQFNLTNGPVTIALDKSGNVYIPDSGNNRVQVFDASGNFIKALGSVGSADGQMNRPSAVAFDSAGNLYVADQNNARIEVFDPNGYFLRKWGSSGTGNGQFAAMYGLAVDSASNVYVSDLFESRVQKFDSQGNFLTTWGSQGNGDGQFLAPVGVATDPVGNVYVADMLNRRIQKFNSSGNLILKFGTAGVGNGTFAWPVGIGVKPNGGITVTDYMGSLVQEFSPNP